jgi:transcriptional regulator with XRE-family HTH domain
MFGEFIKELRARQRLGLREFCLEHGHDPSNWSKIERGVLAPPRDEETLRTWAKQLGLKQGTEDWLKFFDYAAVDAGRIPEYVLKDEQLVAQIWRSCSKSSNEPAIPDRPVTIPSLNLRAITGVSPAAHKVPASRIHPAPGEFVVYPCENSC